ncbi:MAG TPA: Lacal_2735 family protein [Bacteroidales bacterium]|nr:Lacal_2735 family protein [Bacteroidales bacterium]
MLGLFRKKSEKDKLYEQYEKLLKQSHALSTVNRAESDRLFTEARHLLKRIEETEKP